MEGQLYQRRISLVEQEEGNIGSAEKKAKAYNVGQFICSACLESIGRIHFFKSVGVDLEML